MGGATVRDTSGPVTTGTGVGWAGTLGIESWLAPGTVALQHSSEFDDGKHFPLAQHAAALRVSPPAKQSMGLIKTRTARSATEM
jgi:hypothetical protein